jgi:hypothetical protein
MDIHKPTPWHGVREFLKEYAIIVVGVLTALAAEAGVQALHERRLSAEARDAVRAEINLDLANMRRREIKEACIDRRIAELGEFVSKAEARAPFPAPRTIGQPGHLIVYTERWEAATAGGRTSLLSIDEQRDFARVYALLKEFEKYQDAELEAWSELLGLEGVQHPSEDLLARARGALGKARVADHRLRRDLAQAKDRAQRIGIKGEDAGLLVQRDPVDPFCLPMSTATADRGPRG